ncbi:MAG: hypothetical protein PHH59_14240 [Methylovulum sp.]|uniref:hypothetical protein n=1 Tax=Methylovulum sp. TaxID=1916980 RepID=UPI00261A5013|nr:hypothetical protein [Methylovulum sp.]MDD2725164.1 hypothetical protein [Methylovulum sp.]MDD5125558.1 hypothetical protein [Methylovulum sp.]
MNKKNDSNSFFDGFAAASLAVGDGNAAGVKATGMAMPSAGDYRLAGSAVNSAPSFVLGGKVIKTELGSNNSVAVQPDGKILVAGESFNGKYSDFAISRYNPNGSLDVSFDGDGKVTTDFFGSYDVSRSVTVQTDGKIIVAGESYNGKNHHFALARYNSNGSLDTSFDGDGKVTTDFAYNDSGDSVAVQIDGKILVAGWMSNGHSNFAVARYNPNGSLDTSFDGDGKVTTDFDGNDDLVRSVIVQSDGKILVVGYTTDLRDYPRFAWATFTLARYNTNGSLDTSFSGDGKLISSVGGANSATLQADGKILVAGSSPNTRFKIFDFVLVRYNSDGSLDISFDGDGLVTTDFGGQDYGVSVTIQADGKILVAGHRFTADSVRDHSVIALARYNTNGSLDTSFSGDGKVTTAFDSNDVASSVTVQVDGKILVAGGNATVRFNSDGSLDSTFGTPVNSLDGIASYRENGTSIILDNSVQIYDADLSALDNYSGASIILARHGGANSQDMFSFGNGWFSFSGDNVLYIGIIIGTVSNGNGTLKITFNTNATQDRVNLALSSLAYRNASDNPSAKVQIDWTFNDGNTGGQGTGGALTALGSTLVNITAVNDSPTGAVTLLNWATEGQTLIAANTLADADGLGTISYLWYSGSTLLGAGNSYTVKTTDVGKPIMVIASYIDQGGTHESRSSAAQVVGALKNGTGNADVLTGSAGNDIFNGFGGNDTLTGGDGNDRMNGGSGNDKLVGGAGNDIYIVDASGDGVTEAINGGIDSTYTSISLALAANVENLFLIGATKIDGTGNGSANMLVGNAANNVLSAGAGNDLLIGGLGNDTLTGGAGQDIFLFNSPLVANIDKITDFVVADDTIRLENAIFTRLAAPGVLDTDFLKIGPVAADADDFIIYNNATGALFYDADGNGAGASVQIATLGVGLALTNADFVVV